MYAVDKNFFVVIVFVRSKEIAVIKRQTKFKICKIAKFHATVELVSLDQ